MITHSELKKYPAKSNKGTRMGAAIAEATSISAVSADMK